VRLARASARAALFSTFVDALADRMVPPRLVMSDPRQVKLATFIQTKLSKDPRKVLEPDTALVSSGLVDSLSLIQVLAFIEDEFQAVIPDEAATAESMNTIRKIDELIDTYGGSG